MPPGAFENDTYQPYVLGSRFHVFAYYIELDGESWGAIPRWRDITPFTGTKDMFTLPIFPLRLLPEYEKLLARSVCDGKAVINLVNNRFGYHSGWSLSLTHQDLPYGRKMESTWTEALRILKATS